MNIILFGAPGVGKGTQAEILGRRLGIPHISTGEIFREAIATGRELGLRAKAYMDAGNLVPDEITTAMALEKLEGKTCENGFILDGYPRNPNQAQALSQALKAAGREIDHVVYLVAPVDELVERMLKRGRLDDSANVISNRLQVYERETAPVLDYFRKLGLVTEIYGVGEIDEVNERIMDVLTGRSPSQEAAEEEVRGEE